MKNSIQIQKIAAVIVTGLSALLFASIFDAANLLDAGGGLSLALALGAVTYSNIPEIVLASIRRWHGSIDDQYANIDNLINRINNHPDWKFPADLLSTLSANRSQLSLLIAKCRTSDGSGADRTVRNTLLKTTVGLCLTQAKVWAIGEYYAGTLTIDDVHLLGFFVPGETSGHHDRKESTIARAEVKISIIDLDYVRIVIDQAATDNAALVVHGWPHGVRQALIVILQADGTTEVHRQYTTHLYNNIFLPKDTRGQLLIAKASFLRHIDDEPHFGVEPTFTMPLSTEDLAGIIDRQHHEEFEEQLRTVEQHRLDVSQLKNTKIE
ncbi:MAG: hypothetical protein LBS42_02505 [Tannerella sp.]|jgi:hypothetical protein|nr:hypothetical protein [Tannerella sp.]